MYRSLSALLLCAIPMTVAADLLITDYEGGLPVGHFSFLGSESLNVTADVASDTSLTSRPGQVGDNTFLNVDFNISDFGGFGQDFLGSPQDWSSFEGVNFWFFGNGSGQRYKFELADNGTDFGTAERFETEFTDTDSGWTNKSVRFVDLIRSTDFQPPGAPDDGLSLTAVRGYLFEMPIAQDEVGFDDIALTGDHRPVPAPGMFSLLGLGLLQVGLARRRKLRANPATI